METQKEVKGEISTEQLDTDSLNLKIKDIQLRRVLWCDKSSFNKD